MNKNGKDSYAYIRDVIENNTSPYDTIGELTIEITNQKNYKKYYILIILKKSKKRNLKLLLLVGLE